MLVSVVAYYFTHLMFHRKEFIRNKWLSIPSIPSLIIQNVSPGCFALSVKSYSRIFLLSKNKTQQKIEKSHFLKILEILKWSLSWSKFRNRSIFTLFIFFYLVKERKEIKFIFRFATIINRTESNIQSHIISIRYGP